MRHLNTFRKDDNYHFNSTRDSGKQIITKFMIIHFLTCYEAISSHSYTRECVCLFIARGFFPGSAVYMCVCRGRGRESKNDDTTLQSQSR